MGQKFKFTADINQKIWGVRSLAKKVQLVLLQISYQENATNTEPEANEMMVILRGSVSILVGGVKKHDMSASGVFGEKALSNSTGEQLKREVGSQFGSRPR